MTVTELIHGRGTPTTAHELCVRQPLYHEYKARVAEREQAKADMKSRGPR